MDILERGTSEVLKFLKEMLIAKSTGKLPMDSKYVTFCDPPEVQDLLAHPNTCIYMYCEVICFYKTIYKTRFLLKLKDWG